jgi:hypothetical protein
MQTQPPWANESNQPAGQVVAGGSQVLTGQPATNQQVIYVQAPAFKPSPNYRHISYIIIGIGIILSLAISFLTEILGTGGFEELTNSMCCGTLGIACIMDAMYYNDKSAWAKQTGESSSGPVLGMIVNIIFAMICLGLALLFFAIP